MYNKKIYVLYNVILFYILKDKKKKSINFHTKRGI
jgi:hypothetical protein